MSSALVFFVKGSAATEVYTLPPHASLPTAILDRFTTPKKAVPSDRHPRVELLHRFTVVHAPITRRKRAVRPQVTRHQRRERPSTGLLGWTGRGCPDMLDR